MMITAQYFPAGAARPHPGLGEFSPQFIANTIRSGELTVGRRPEKPARVLRLIGEVFLLYTGEHGMS